MISISHYLYRITGRKVTRTVFTIFVLIGSVLAQGRPEMRHREQPSEQPPAAKQPTKGNARAIGVVEFLPKGGVRLIPVALWINNRYYDASLYGANPEPFALEPATVYQAEDYGEPTGLFTVTLPKQIKGTWVADGQWTPHLNMDAKLAGDAAKEAAKLPPKKPSKAVMTGDADEGPPVFRKSGSSVPAETSKSTDTSKAPAGNSAPASPTAGQPPTPTAPGAPKSGRPTLSRPGDDPEPVATTPSSSTNKLSTRDDDPDRPTLKASATPPVTSPSIANGASPTTPQPSPPSSNDNDPGRPVLQRGAPPSARATTSASKTGSPPQGSKSATKNSTPVANVSSAATPAGSRKSYPAISDAGTYETRSMLYSMSSADRDRAVQQLQKLGLGDLQSYTTKRKVAPLPKTAILADYDLRAFDLDFSNSPTLVFTAKLPLPGRKTLNGGEFDYFVTIVARQDFNGDLQKVFSSVTDSDYLDAVPRMETVGAVDASANGRGDLLFRQYSDGNISYILYRVFPYQMQKLFEGGASM